MHLRLAVSRASRQGALADDGPRPYRPLWVWTERRVPRDDGVEQLLVLVLRGAPRRHRRDGFNSRRALQLPRRPWSSTGQLIIYKGPTVRRSTAARRLRGGCSGGSAGRVRRCPTSSGTLYSLPARRSPTCGACSLGCGTSKFVVFALPARHFRCWPRGRSP